MNTTITPSQIFDKKQILSVETAKSLKGKKIATTNREYKYNSPRVSIFVVGEIISEWDYAATQPMNEKHKTRKDYWESYMSEDQIDEMKTKLILFSEDGGRFHVAHTKYHNFYSEPTFTGSDADREVYYIEIEDEN